MSDNETSIEKPFDAFYKVERDDASHGSWSTDYTSGMANKYGLSVKIRAKHLSTSKNSIDVKFKAFLTSYKEQFSTDLKKEKLVGHHEPLRKVTGIERTLAIGLAIPAFSLTDARNNLEAITRFVQMFYPLTEVVKASGVPQQYVKSGGDPLFDVSFMNLLGASPDNISKFLNLWDVENVAPHGLQTGYIDNLNYDFDVAQSFYVTSTGYSYPKLINLSFNFYPLYEVSPHWQDQGIQAGSPGEKTFSHTSFPYSIQNLREPSANLRGIPTEGNTNPFIAAALADNVTDRPGEE
jgi:hypothetical protein|tara:strand:+ start:6836 stop:7717 length:882 start_codon:yes stop_codon:yes gene_type:complete